MMEWWNNGRMGSVIKRCWVNAYMRAAKKSKGKDNILAPPTFHYPMIPLFHAGGVYSRTK
jgi:hypothetical protein